MIGLYVRVHVIQAAFKLQPPAVRHLAHQQWATEWEVRKAGPALSLGCGVVRHWQCRVRSPSLPPDLRHLPGHLGAGVRLRPTHTGRGAAVGCCNPLFDWLEGEKDWFDIILRLENRFEKCFKDLGMVPASLNRSQSMRQLA